MAGTAKVSGSTTVTRARKGDAGAPGITYRISIWESGKVYRNDSALTSGERIIDVCYNKDVAMYSDQTLVCLECARTHTSDETSAPLVVGQNWREISSFIRPISTPLLLANAISADYIDVVSIAGKQAFINALTVNKLTVKDTNDNVIAKIGDMSDYTVDNVTAKFPFWIGGATPAGAVTTIDSTGKLTTTNIVAKGGKIGNFDITSGLWLQASGDHMSSGTYAMGFSAADFYLRATNIPITVTDKNGIQRSLSQTSGLQFAGYESAISSSSGRLLAQLSAIVNNSSGYDIQYRNVALQLEASGSAKYSISPEDGYGRKGNFAVVSKGGKFLGWRPEVREVTGNDVTLYPADCVIIVNGATQITFPASPEDGQTYFIYITGRPAVTLNFGSIKCWRNNVGYGSSSSAPYTHSHGSGNFTGIDIVTYSARKNEWTLTCCAAG